MKRAIFLLCALACAAPAGAFNLNSAVKEMAARPGLQNASWGISVKDAATGRGILERDAQKNLIPASILKVFVTAAAFDLLGPGYRFKTGVYYDGDISNGSLNGNIYIMGAGDPSLGSQFIKDARSADDTFRLWADAIKAKGINVINGAVVGDDSLFESVLPGSWAWEDIGNYYAAGPSALTINDNLYKLYFKPGENPGDKADVLRTEPYLPEMTFENYVLTGPAGSGDNGYIYAFPGRYEAVLRGTVPQGPEEFPIKGALPDPALFAARSFGGFLSRAGINADKKPYKTGEAHAGKPELVTETEGSPLADIVRVLNKRSFNLYAELLLRRLAVSRGLKGTAAAGIKVLKDFLAAQGADTSELKLVDASGLSRVNMTKAANFTDLLCSVSKKKYFEAFRDTLVFPDDPEATGYIRRLGSDSLLAAGLRIKSGSMSGVRAYAGYLQTRKGRTLAFTFIVNSYSAASADIDKLHEDLLLKLAEHY